MRFTHECKHIILPPHMNIYLTTANYAITFWQSVDMSCTSMLNDAFSCVESPTRTSCSDRQSSGIVTSTLRLKARGFGTARRNLLTKGRGDGAFSCFTTSFTAKDTRSLLANGTHVPPSFRNCS